jgi:hypothetical protein
MMVIGYTEKEDEDGIPMEFVIGAYDDAQEAAGALQQAWLDCENNDIEYFWMGHKTGEAITDYKITSVMDYCPAKPQMVQ